MDVQLREARVDDAAEIARLAGELGYPVSAADMQARLAQLLPLSTHRICVVDDGDHLLGWIAIERRTILELGDGVEIMGLVVGADARQGGVGRMLVNEGERWALASGVRVIRVRSNVLRDASHPFYERLGYERRKTQHVYSKALDTAR